MPDEPSAPEHDAPAQAASAPSGPETREDWETRFKYLLADFENFRRRAGKEKEAATRQARAAMVRELLPLIEAFRAGHDAVAHLPPSDAIRRGFELLDREWSTFLKREGVEPVAEVGRPFQAEETSGMNMKASSAAQFTKGGPGSIR